MTHDVIFIKSVCEELLLSDSTRSAHCSLALQMMQAGANYLHNGKKKSRVTL